MNVELVKYPTEDDWILCKDITLCTVGKSAKTPPTFDWKVKMLQANHSPIRTLNFCFKITDVPSWVATHLVRHVHAIPFVKSQRNDRQGDYDRNAARQDTPVNMYWYMNAEELITICHKRLCTKASKETREVIEFMAREVIKTNQEFKTVLVPMCYYRNGLCTEFEPCGMCNSVKDSETSTFGTPVFF